MMPAEVNEFVRKAENLYENQLRSSLEREHLHEFVAIEPESGQYFLGRSLNEATEAARKSFPGRLTHAMRIGHRAALHFGLHIR